MGPRAPLETQAVQPKAHRSPSTGAGEDSPGFQRRPGRMAGNRRFSRPLEGEKCCLVMLTQQHNSSKR